MTQIRVPVSWKDGKPHAPDVPVGKSEGETTIVWTAGDGIARFEILDLDTDEFVDQGHNPGKTEWVATDKNSTPPWQRPKAYKYAISAVSTDGQVGYEDPAIVNTSG